jgi:hypothetical protein
MGELEKRLNAYLTLRKAYNKVHAFWDKVLTLIRDEQIPPDFLAGAGERQGRGWLHRANHFRCVPSLVPMCVRVDERAK